MADGAAVIIMASGNYVIKNNLKPLARIVSYADGSLDPKQFCVAPAIVVPKVMNYLERVSKNFK